MNPAQLQTYKSIIIKIMINQLVIEDVLNAQHMAILSKMVQVWWLSSELSLTFSDLRCGPQTGFAYSKTGQIRVL